MILARYKRLLALAALAFAAGAYSEPLSDLLGPSSNLMFAAEDALRTWSDSSGKFKIEASLVSNENGQVKLLRKDGQSVTLPISKLSKEDQKYLASLDGKDSDAKADKKASEKDKGTGFGLGAALKLGIIRSDKADADGAGQNKKENASQGALGKALRDVVAAGRADAAAAKEFSFAAPSTKEFSLGGQLVQHPTFSCGVHVGKLLKVDPGAPGTSRAWRFKPVRFEAHDFSSIGSIHFCDDPTLMRLVPKPKLLPPWPVNVNKYFYAAYSGGMRDRRESVIERGDPSDGSDVIFRADVGEPEFVDVSPDGKYALGIVATANQSDRLLNTARKGRLFEAEKKSDRALLGFYRLDDSSDKPEAKLEGLFYPYYALAKDPARDIFMDIDNAYWIDSVHVLTKTRREIALWDVSKGVAVYQISLSLINGNFFLEPSRRYFVLFTDRWFSFYEAAGGRPIGTLSFEQAIREKGLGEAREYRFSLAATKCAFSPTGEKMAAFYGNNVAVFDLATGKCERAFSVDGFKPLIMWPTEDTLLIGQRRYELATGFPIDEELFDPNDPTGNLNMESTISYGGGFLTFGGSGYGPHEFHKYELPKFETMEGMNLEDTYAVYPGASVAVKVETNGLLNDSEARAELEKLVKGAGFKLDPKSALTLVASCKELREETFEYGSAEQTHRFVPVLPSQVKYQGEVTLKVFEQKIEFVLNGESLWVKKDETSGPGQVEADPNKSPEQCLKDANHPDVVFYRAATLPRYVHKDPKKRNKKG